MSAYESFSSPLLIKSKQLLFLVPSKDWEGKKKYEWVWKEEKIRRVIEVMGVVEIKQREGWKCRRGQIHWEVKIGCRREKRILEYETWVITALMDRAQGQMRMKDRQFQLIATTLPHA